MLASLPAPPPMSCPARLYIYVHVLWCYKYKSTPQFMIVQFLSSIGKWQLYCGAHNLIRQRHWNNFCTWCDRVRAKVQKIPKTCETAYQQDCSLYTWLIGYGFFCRGSMVYSDPRLTIKIRKVKLTHTSSWIIITSFESTLVQRCCRCLQGIPK